MALWLWRGRPLRAALPVFASRCSRCRSCSPISGSRTDTHPRRPEPRQRHLRRRGHAARARRRRGRARRHAGRRSSRSPRSGPVALARRRPAVAAFALVTIAVPPARPRGRERGGDERATGSARAISSSCCRSGSRSSPTGASRARSALSTEGVRRRPRCDRRRCGIAPAAVSEPRTIPTGAERAVAAPAAWLADAARAGRRAVSLLARLPRGASGGEGSASVLARAGGPRPRGANARRDHGGLHVDPPARAGRAETLAKRGSAVPRVPLVAHPRVTRPVRERNEPRSNQPRRSCEDRSARDANPTRTRTWSSFSGTACAALVRLGSAC